MTGIIVGSVAGAAGVFYSRPVFDADGKVIGAVVLRIKADPIGRILANAAASGSDRMPFLVDERRRDRLAPGREAAVQEPRAAFARRRSTRSSPTSASAARRSSRIDQPELARVVVGRQAARQREPTSRTSRKREEIAGFAPVPGHDWVVGVSESRDYFAAPLQRLFENVLMQRGARRARIFLAARDALRAQHRAPDRAPHRRRARAEGGRLRPAPTSRCAPTTRSASSRAPST